VNSIFGNHNKLTTNSRLKLYLKSAKQLTQVLQSKSSPYHNSEENIAHSIKKNKEMIM